MQEPGSRQRSAPDAPVEEAAGSHGFRSAGEAESVLREIARALSFASLDQSRPERRQEPVPLPDELPAALGIVTTNAVGVIQSWNRAAEAMLGQPAARAVGRPLGELLVPARDAEARSGRAAGGVREMIGLRPDRSQARLAVSTADVAVAGQLLRILALRDLGEQRLAQARLRKTEARFRALVEQIPAVTFTAGLAEDRSELYVSPQIEALLGYTQEEWLGNPILWYERLHPDDRDHCNHEFARGCRSGGPFHAEFRALSRRGEVVWVRGDARVVRDEAGQPLFIQGIAYDVTDSKRAEAAVRASAAQLESSLREKEVLLEEIHHRVKNNLQVISSLLRLQSAQVEDRAVLGLFAESCDRIHSMALVHEKLCESADLSRIDFADYVASLSALLQRSYPTTVASVVIENDVESAALDIDVAVPLGLILNELVANALKYAFPDGRSGRIRIELRAHPPAQYLLRIADDGVGLPADFDLGGTGTLGMQLVCALTEQLDGAIELAPGPGADFRIRFSPAKR